MHSVESSESACMHMHAIRDEEGTGTLEFSHGLSYYKVMDSQLERERPKARLEERAENIGKTRDREKDTI